MLRWVADVARRAVSSSADVLADRADKLLLTLHHGAARTLAETETGYRIYSPGTVARVRFVRRAKEIGFSLTESRSFLRFRQNPAPPAATSGTGHRPSAPRWRATS